MGYGSTMIGVGIDRSGSTVSSDRGQTEKPKRQYQVAARIEILEKEIAAQRDIILRLTNRLEPALSGTDAVIAGQLLASQGESPCPLAGAVQRMSAQVAENSATIESLIDRLEL